MAARNKNTKWLVAPAASASHRTSGSLVARSLMVVALIASALFAAAFVTAQENTPEASSTPEGTPAATPSAEMPRLELELEELNDSGIEGTVTLFDAGERTIVEFDIEGAGGDHPANISAGVCGDLDPEPAYELEPVDENGESLTVVDVTLDELLESEHAIDVRLAPDQLGTLIACANIEGKPEVPVAGTPEATAEASPTGEGGQVATETPDVTVAGATETPVSTTEATVETTPDATTPESSPTDGTGGTVNVGEPATTIALRELNDSGVTGSVILSSQGEATRISIQLEGDAVTGDHIAHLHSGTCEVPGEYTYTLNPVSEEGASETVVNITLDELLTGGYMVNVHPSEENWDAWMVCGELTGTTTPAATTEATVTPAPTTEAGGQVTTPTETPAATDTTMPATTTPVIPVQTIPPAPTGDGTSGVTGAVTADTSVQTLPQTAGVGAMLEWPTDPRSAILWATTGAAIILAAAALVIRRGERQTMTTPSRWTRLGI